MTEISAELKRRLVSGRKRDGRCAYDPVAKAELVQSCMQPGVSVSRMALQYGINANLLRRWITQRPRHLSVHAVQRCAPNPALAFLRRN